MIEVPLEPLEQEDKSNLPLENYFFHIFYWQYSELLVDGGPAAKRPGHSYGLGRQAEV